MRILAIGRHCSAHYGEQQNNDIFLACLIMARILVHESGRGGSVDCKRGVDGSLDKARVVDQGFISRRTSSRSS